MFNVGFELRQVGSEASNDTLARQAAGDATVEQVAVEPAVAVVGRLRRRYTNRPERAELLQAPAGGGQLQQQLPQQTQHSAAEEGGAKRKFSECD